MLTDPSGLAPPTDAYMAGDGDFGYGDRTPRIGEWVPFQNTSSFPYYSNIGHYQLEGEAWIRYNADGSVSVVGDIFVIEANGARWMATPNAAELALWNWNRTKDDKYLCEPALQNFVNYWAKNFGRGDVAIKLIAEGLADPKNATGRLNLAAMGELLRPVQNHEGLQANRPIQSPSTRGSSQLRPPASSYRYKWRGPSIQSNGQTGLRDPAKVDTLKNDMKNGCYRFTSEEGQIGGWRDSKGNYYIGEGHHRMNAAMELYEETGDSTFVNNLLRFGRWDTGRPSPVTPLPRR